MQDVTSGVKISILAQFFKVLKDTDRPGKALTIVEHVDSLEACMALCVRIPKCVGFNYINLEGNTNYLRCILNAEVYPERPAIYVTGDVLLRYVPPTPTLSTGGSDSGKPFAPLFSTQPGTDRPGRFLKVVDDVASVDKCMAECAYNPECVVFNYIGVRSSKNYRRCILNKVIYASKAVSGVTSGVKLSKLPEFFKLWAGTNRPGAYVERVENVGSAEECMVQCMKNEKCVAFNYIGLKVNWNYRRCFLNAEVHPEVSIPGITSAVLLIEETDEPDGDKPVPVPTSDPGAGITSSSPYDGLFKTQPGIGFFGAFWKKVDDVKSAESCMKLCVDNVEFVSFNYFGKKSSVNYGQCVLNAEIYKSKLVAHITSGVKLSTLAQFFKVTAGTDRPGVQSRRLKKWKACRHAWRSAWRIQSVSNSTTIRLKAVQMTAAVTSRQECTRHDQLPVSQGVYSCRGGRMSLLGSLRRWERTSQVKLAQID